VPLLLAGVDYLLPIYREANTTHIWLDKGITGNPDDRAGIGDTRRSLILLEPYLRVMSRAR
jgi:hypothetical protein